MSGAPIGDRPAAAPVPGAGPPGRRSARALGRVAAARVPRAGSARGWRAAAAVAVAAVAVAGGARLVGGEGPAAAAAARQAVAPADVVTEIGRSVKGVALEVRARGVERAASTRTVLVVGEVHGDEPGGPRITRALRDAELPPGTRLLLVDALNPDGLARGTRQNAHRVDLNRNARTGWKPGHRGDRFWGGPKPFSEPESRAIRALLQAERPDVTVWLHQPYALVDRPERGTGAEARAYAEAVDLPYGELGRKPGSLSRWTNATLGPDHSFVVELAAGRPPVTTIAKHVGAVLALLGG